MAAKDPTGKAAPSGGFKTGGWYSGYQYWEGSFAPQAGAIHPKSTQAGAGQLVSAEVVAQTDPANVAYLARLRAEQAPQQPRTQEEVTPYLNQFQGELFKAREAPEIKVPTMEELKEKLAPGVPYPEPLRRVEKFEELRLEYGVAELETSLSDIKAQIDEEFALLREQRGIEEGKPVPLGVIAGRITEEERTAQERIDFLGRQQARIADELNTKYTLITTYMNLMGLDYNDAVKRYDDEFGRNVQMYGIILQQEARVIEAWEYQQTAARANLQIFVNAVTAGNLSYTDMSTDQKLMVSKLEAQSGLPMGFVSNLKMSFKDRLLSVNDKTGEALMIGEDGKFRVIQTGMRPTPTTGAKPGTEAATREGFLAEAKIITGRNIAGTWVGEFPLLVQKYAPFMALEAIYRIYMDSELGKKYGSPSEDPAEIKRIYDRARGKEED